MAALAFIGAVAVSLVDCGVTLGGSQDFQLSTALMIPVLGLFSGLILGRAYWGISESSFRQMDSR